MTAPQFPAAWGQPPAPAPAQAPGYPPQQFAPQAPPAQYAPPAAPQQYAQPGYPPAQPGYAPAGPYGVPPAYDPYAAQQYAPPQPPAFQPAQGTLDEYMSQRPAGAQYWKFDNPGRVLIGMVERDLRDSDVAQVSFNGQPVRRRDQSISTEMALTVPVVNPDGTKALIEFRGHQRTAFEEACSAGTGGASRLPKGGGMIRGTFTHTEPSRGGGSPKKIVNWEYVPPEQVQGGQVPQGPPPAAAAMPQPTPQSSADQFAGYAQAQQAMAAPAAQFPAQPAQDPQYAAYLAQQAAQAQGAPQQAAPAQQYAAPPAPAAYPQAQPAPVPSPNPGAGAQGAPAPQAYAPPGMDPATAAQFAGLMGGAPPAQ